MIVDNVDDRSLFFDSNGSTEKALCEYIPQSPNGTILYTTRNRDIGTDLAPAQDPIEVPSMTLEEATSLLGDKIRASNTEEDQRLLVEELVYLPLAITQATAFMTKRHKKISEYIKLYRQDEATKFRLLGQRFKSHGRDNRPQESVTTTWWISFNHIRTENERAADLLSIMSFLDRQDIPLSLLRLPQEDAFDFDEAVGVLEAFSLITLSATDTACNIHRLVQIATRAWLAEYENKRDQYAAEALSLLADRYPDGFFENWSTCAAYLPHAYSILRYNFAEKDASISIDRATLLLHLSSYLRRQGKFDDSERGAEESMALHKQFSGARSPATLNSMANYALTIHKKGRYEEACALQRIVLQGREEVLGPNDRATLETLNALGFDLQTLGRYKEALPLHERELAAKQKILEGDPTDVDLEADVLIAMNNVARGLEKQGDRLGAEKLHRDALERSEVALGKDHPDTFITMGELASVRTLLLIQRSF